MKTLSSMNTVSVVTFSSCSVVTLIGHIRSSVEQCNQVQDMLVLFFVKRFLRSWLEYYNSQTSGHCALQTTQSFTFKQINIKHNTNNLYYQRNTTCRLCAHNTIGSFNDAFLNNKSKIWISTTYDTNSNTLHEDEHRSQQVHQVKILLLLTRRFSFLWYLYQTNHT